MFVTPPDTEDSFDKYDEPRLHMERLMKAKLVEFDLSLRLLLRLESAGIITLGDLTRQTRQSLLQISQFGKGYLETIEKFLAYHRLALSE